MKDNNMNVVILAGGKGTRMRELTDLLPKPMVTIGGKPVLEHLIDYFESFRSFNFVICTGYKEEIIEDYFSNKKKFPNVNILQTGIETNTGGRILECKKIINGKFIMTYGDGLSDINIDNLLNFNQSKKESATISMTRPVSRFGLVKTNDDNVVTSFVEKPILDSYINMGYMVLDNSVFDYIEGDEPFENKPLIRMANNRELNGFKHDGFFRPMDTYREYLELNDLWDENKAPWKIL